MSIKYRSYNREFMKGMVETTIFRIVFTYFLNSMLISVYFDLKFLISYL